MDFIFYSWVTERVAKLLTMDTKAWKKDWAFNNPHIRKIRPSRHYIAKMTCKASISELCYCTYHAVRQNMMALGRKKKKISTFVRFVFGRARE